MAIIDFREIPEAGKASGAQDSFELFAREVLKLLGFEIVQSPSRGADGGKDIIVEETRVGLISNTKIRWLVSCKHYAFSGKSVGVNDEVNIFERVSASKCNGFMGFYSTLPSSGLNELLHQQSAVIFKMFDRDEIERHLLESVQGRKLINRYFPLSAKKLAHTPPKIFADTPTITCDYCGKDLVETRSGIWVIWRTVKEVGETRIDRYVDMHFACKGKCDRIIESRVKQQHVSLGFIYDGWDDIPDMAIPAVYITKIMTFLNGLFRGDEYEPEVFEKVKFLLLATFPLVARHLSDEDQENLARLQTIPSYLGGMGYDS